MTKSLEQGSRSTAVTISHNNTWYHFIDAICYCIISHHIHTEYDFLGGEYSVEQNSTHILSDLYRDDARLPSGSISIISYMISYHKRYSKENWYMQAELCSHCTWNTHEMQLHTLFLLSTSSQSHHVLHALYSSLSFLYPNALSCTNDGKDSHTVHIHVIHGHRGGGGGEGGSPDDFFFKFAW